MPVDPADPADPAYDFTLLDAAVRDAAGRGLEVVLVVASAPDYAEGPGRDPAAPPGTWKPDPGAIAAFATALARRYSGGYAGLPRVTDYQLWNEPNLPVYLTPQYENGALAAPAHYRLMLNAFHDAIKLVEPSTRVITAGTAPFGDPRGLGPRTSPLLFWRNLLCLSDRRKLKPTACPVRARFDVLAHHPINSLGAPTTEVLGADDAATMEFDQVVRTLRAAERHGTVDAAARHPVWATELWWDTDPPDSIEGVALALHARWTQQALYLLWRQGAKVVLSFQVRDEPFDPGNPFTDSSTGLYFADGVPKPARTAFRFPLVGDRLDRGAVRIWGRAPTAGKLRIERRARGRWRLIEATLVSAGEVFQTKTAMRGRERLRGRVGGEHSLVWVQRGPS